MILLDNHSFHTDLPPFTLVAEDAVRLALDVDVLVAGEGPVTLVAAKMFQMENFVLGAGVFRRENQFVARRTSEKMEDLDIV